jgi:hypothetical protein
MPDSIIRSQSLEHKLSSALKRLQTFFLRLFRVQGHALGARRTASGELAIGLLIPSRAYDLSGASPLCRLPECAPPKSYCRATGKKRVFLPSRFISMLRVMLTSASKRNLCVVARLLRQTGRSRLRRENSCNDLEKIRIETFADFSCGWI